MKDNKKSQYQGVSHLLIILMVPALALGAYFADNSAIRVLMISLIVLLGILIWKKILNN